ncbi:MAG: TonB-dependent receptor domain-containing protein [Steroidobacterales bacterium]
MNFNKTGAVANSFRTAIKVLWMGSLAGALFSFLAASALAQQAAETSEPALQEIIVTGSRIAAPNEQSTSPIQVLSSEYIDTTGKSDISDIINHLPQNFTNSLGQDLGNGTSGLTTAGGVATADLRGLGPNRTLVLVDGRRLGQGSPSTYIASPAPDLDQIPAGLVERVEVVTGGASAAYGADAVAGVVNFIMKKDFQGFQVDGNYAGYLHDNGDTGVESLVRQFGATPATGTSFDGRSGSLDMLMGTNFADNTGNVTAFFSYRHQSPVAGSERDYGGCQLDNYATDANGTITGAGCDGSSNSNFFHPLTGPNTSTAYSVSGHSLVPRGSVATTPPSEFNSQPYIYLTREDDRYNAAFLAHQEVTPYFQPYAEFYFMDDRTHQQIAPAALFRGLNPTDPSGTGNYPVNCDNPLLSGQQAGTLCSPAQLAYVAANPGQPCVFTAAGTSPNCADVEIGRRNVEGGGRFSDYEHENYRGVFGFKGDIDEAKNFTFDVYGQYYYTTFFNNNDKYLNLQGIDNALQVTGTAANPKCISGGSCVPYNIWEDGGVTQQQLNYLYLIGTAQGTSTLRTVHGEVTGHLGEYGVKSPLANDGVAFDVGFEHRDDHEQFQPDSAEQSGLLSGFGSAAVPIDNTVAVSEEFLELRAPILQNLTWVHELLFDGGYRHSLYSSSGPTDTYKFEVQFAPVQDYRLRVSYDKAIRAPSVVELFNPRVIGSAALGADPCAPTFNPNGTFAAPALYSLAQCLRLGATAAQYGNGGSTDTIPQGTAGQLSQVQGGNPNLTPEQAETYTIGVNFAPSQIPGFSGSIDYWHIDIFDEVTSIPFNVIESQCADSGNPIYCSQIVRNPVTGSLTGGSISGGGYILQTNVNAGAGVVSGVDLQLSYHHNLPANLGGIGVQVNGTYLQHDLSTPLPGQHTYECAGLYGDICQTVNPRWQHILQTTWTTPWKVSASLTWHYFGKVELDQNQQDPTLHFNYFGTYDAYNAVIPAYNYFDIEAEWHVSKMLTLRAGINNVTDKDPPIMSLPAVAGSGYANTLPPYDMLGRQLFASFTARL